LLILLRNETHSAAKGRRQPVHLDAKKISTISLKTQLFLTLCVLYLSDGIGLYDMLNGEKSVIEVKDEEVCNRYYVVGVVRFFGPGESGGGGRS
jgi:hypothetical protein